MGLSTRLVNLTAISAEILVERHTSMRSFREIRYRRVHFVRAQVSISSTRLKAWNLIVAKQSE
jgi:hypothetical protein